MKPIPFLLFTVSAFLIISCNHKKGFSISGRLTGVADSTQVMLQNMSTGEYIDSAIIINSGFVFGGHLKDEPEELRVISGPAALRKGLLFYTDLLIGNETVQLSADIADLPYHAETTGSSTQDEAERYYKEIYIWNKKLDTLKKDYQSIPDSVDPQGKKQAAIRIREAQDSLENWKIGFLKNNFNTYFSLLTYNYRRDFDIDTLKILFNSVSDDLKQSKYGKAIKTQIAHPKPRVGNLVYDFKAINMKGDSLKLSEISDDYILLQFAGTGCYFSHQAIQNMKGLHQTYKDSIAFVSYFVDPQKDLWLNYTQVNDLPWSSLWNNGGKYTAPYNQYWVNGTPTFFILTPSRKVVATWFGYEEGIIEQNIQQVFKSGKDNAPL